ncbi:hypothetical protein [Thermoanaerobacter wiegelii]|uniref:Uncharacterized protein n=1 Tax=Thermoanaerobacter wiegelii Rt8.B1 TaxID=697303 RepID=G2MW80_9THEO|nr:hypothetical protein [Thermoanaerobacter wiegelii]AEM78250.1 hypothetical protein Thewi_0816 [Thermoanaerobacter wiegelii Rt8.B1]
MSTILPTIYRSDWNYILIVALIYIVFIKFHRVLIPRKYFSIQELIYEGDVKKTVNSSATRILIIVVLSIVFYHVLGYSEKQIKTGIFIGSFLIVWPALVQYKLLSFYKNRLKTAYLAGYLVFIIFSVIIAHMTIRYLCPMIFDGEEFVLVSNDGIAILYTLMSYAFPVTFEGLVSKNIVTSIYKDIDTFHEDLKIVKYQLELEYPTINAYYYEISEAAKENNINVDLLTTILTLEYINRGQWYNRLMETILCKYFPSIAIRKDISAGLAQIKISTAKDVLRQSPFKFVKKLVNTEFNISLCAKYLKKIYDGYYKDLNQANDDLYTYVTAEFLSGTKASREKNVMLYSAIIRDQCKDGFEFISDKEECWDV